MKGRMKLQPYLAYKDSGVPWLGDVPAHWEALPNRTVFSERIAKGYSGEPLLSVTIRRGIIRQESLLTDTSKKDSSNDDKSSYKLVEPGDIAYNKMRAWQGAIGLSEFRGIVSPAYVVIRPQVEIHPRYFHFLYRTPAFAKEAERWSYGITSDQWSLRYKDFKSIYSLVPPLPEQHAIAHYLDHADRRINRYIRAKRKLIALLNEQKQAIIHQAVTRGLDPDVPLRPSGVEWLGEIPAHWEIVRLRNLVSHVTSGSRGWSNFASDDGPLFLRVANLTRDTIKIKLDSIVRLKLPDTSEANRTRVSYGDILLSITAYIGSVAVVPGSFPEAYVSQHVALCRLRDDKHNPFWIGYFLLSPQGRVHGSLSLYGGTKDGLSLTDVKDNPILIPPRVEQDQLVEHIAYHLDTIGRRQNAIQRQIDLIREYRTRLIADVVTGKLDVRGAVLLAELMEDSIEEPDIEEEPEEEPAIELEEAFVGD